MDAFLDAATLADSPFVRVFIEKFPLPAAVVINEKVHMANEAYARLTGYDSPELLRGMHVSEFIDSSDRTRFMQLNRNGHAGLVSGRKYQWKYSVKGEVRFVEGHPTIFRIGDDTVLISTVVDITSSVLEKQRLEMEKSRLIEENDRLWERIGKGMNICIGNSVPIKRMMATAQKLAGTDACVVIMGETGTGKSVVAGIIHDLSKRGKGPMITVNCAAIPEQLMESEFFGCVKGAFTGANQDRTGFLGAAHNGTLFLDEIGELGPAMQAKLLHAVERKRYIPVGSTRELTADVRLVCATNRNLRQMVDEGHFREDLFYRIFVGDLRIPSLRERMEDVPDLVSFFLARFGMDKTQTAMPPALMRKLMNYSWPGNVRELQNVILRYIATGELRLLGATQTEAKSTQLAQAEIDLRLPLGQYLENSERDYLKQAILACGGRKDKAAERLGVNLRTFHRKCSRLGL